MKKIITFLLTIVLVAGLLPAMYVFADDTPTFTVNVDKEKIFYNNPEHDQLEVTIKANATFNGVAFVLSYDTDLLTYKEYIGSDDGLFEKRDKYDENGKPNGKIGFSGADMDNYTYSDDVIFTVIFDVNKDKDVNTESEIKLELDGTMRQFDEDANKSLSYEGHIEVKSATVEFYTDENFAEFRTVAEPEDVYYGTDNEVVVTVKGDVVTNGAKFALEYDPNLLSYNSLNGTPLGSSGRIRFNLLELESNLDEGLLTIFGAATVNRTYADEDMFKVTFDVKPNATIGDTPLESLIDLKLNREDLYVIVGTGSDRETINFAGTINVSPATVTFHKAGGGEDVAVETVAITKDSATITSLSTNVNDEVTLGSAITPANATNPTYSWTATGNVQIVGDADKANVTIKGTAVGSGDVKLTVVAGGATKDTTVNVTVVDEPVVPQPGIEEIEINKDYLTGGVIVDPFKVAGATIVTVSVDNDFDITQNHITVKGTAAYYSPVRNKFVFFATDSVTQSDVAVASGAVDDANKLYYGVLDADSDDEVPGVNDITIALDITRFSKDYVTYTIKQRLAADVNGNGLVEFTELGDIISKHFDNSFILPIESN